MKKIISTLFLSLILSSPVLYADKAEFMRNMVYVNPVPNYVAVIMPNADKLALSDKQKSAVKEWNNKHGKQMAAMVKSVIDGEAQIKTASMDGASIVDIKTMAQKLMDTRLQIITGKTTCRDYVMEVLSDEQWTRLTDIIKSGS